MAKHSHAEISLTKNQSLVMNALSIADGPMSAYAILDELRDEGLKAPLQIYRALDKLVEFGLVHRLESMNAFVACQFTSCDNEKQETVVFTICEKCGNVQELVSSRLINAIGALAGEIDFSFSKSVIELRGLCAACKNA